MDSWLKGNVYYYVRDSGQREEAFYLYQFFLIGKINFIVVLETNIKQVNTCLIVNFGQVKSVIYN